MIVQALLPFGDCRALDLAVHVGVTVRAVAPSLGSPFKGRRFVRELFHLGEPIDIKEREVGINDFGSH